MSKKTQWIGLLVLLVIVAIFTLAYSGSNKTTTSNVPIKIGVVGHFSGEYASYGAPMKNAIQMATEEFQNKNELKRPVELVIEDDAYDAAKAASAVNKLINVDRVDYLISAQGSGITSAIIPIAQNNKRILMITLGSAPGFTKAGEYIFRSVPSDNYQAKKISDFISRNLGAKKIAGLYLNNAYGVGVRDNVVSDPRLQNSISEMFKDGSTDFRTSLLKIKEQKPEVLIVTAYEKEFPQILRQAKELGITAKIVASETFKDDKILANSGPVAEGVYVPFIATPTDHVGFSGRYQTRWNEAPSAYSMYAYDGALVLLKAIVAGKGNSSAVLATLPSIAFDGASGHVAFDSNRERTGLDYSMYIVKNGKFELVTK